MAAGHQFKRRKSDSGMPQKNPRDSMSNEEIRRPNRPICVKVYVVTVPIRIHTKSNYINRSPRKYIESSRRTCFHVFTVVERIGKGTSPFNLYAFVLFEHLFYNEKALTLLPGY